ncbi:retrovirus-related pol polyprotein from transposon TNT 1-94 [Tanacetum coccineum]
MDHLLNLTVNNAGPMKNVINNAYSTARRPFNKITAANNSNFTKKVNTVKGTRVNTARPKAVLSAVKGNKGNAVKASACWVWRPKHKILDHGNPQQDLKDKGVIDSGCSRHMIGNKSYLIDYEKIDGGFVAFGSNSKGGKINEKGKIKTGKLDFKDVYFVMELRFNLFSVSQMCDKKNNVLFTNTECVVLSPDFKRESNTKNSNSSAQQDALILSVIEQLKTQVANCTKINLENKSVNDTLTAELERYKEQVKVLNEGQNVALTCNDNVSDSCAQSVEIDRLKQTLSEHLKEKESLMQTVSLLKDDFKKEESRNIDREIALEKRIKQLDNIVFKRDQSAQIVHMLMKPQFFYDHTTKQALEKHPIVIPNSEETLMLAEESRSKMLLKQKDPMMLEKKVNTTPVDYATLNQLYKDFETRFVLQTELSAKQAFWSQNSVNSPEPILSSRPTVVEVTKELPKVSMVNTSLKKLKHHLAGFDVVVKERTTPTAITEGRPNCSLDSNLEVAFCQHTCFIHNFEGVDLLTGSRCNNLYTLSLGDMMASSPICLLSKASKTKSWLWHRRLSHLNFGAINHLARHGLIRGLPKLKFEKDHLCSACAMGKSTKKPRKPKSEDTNQEKLYLLHMDLCGPMRVASVNGKKYILVIVDDYSRFTWVNFLRSKDEALDFIIKFLKMIQVRLQVTVRRIRTDNGTEFVNQTLRKYYEKIGISHETSVSRSPQQNGVVERRNRTLIEAARTMLIYAKAPLFLWAEAVATACYTQNRSIIRLRHDKTPYELLHDKPPDLSFFHVFGALCYPTNDNENLGKLQPKANIGIFIGYAPIKKAFQIYNRRTRRIIETIHVDFDELTAMASEHSSSRPVLHEMTPATISS